MNLCKEGCTKQRTQRHRIQTSSKSKTIMSEKKIGERCNEDIGKKINKYCYRLLLDFVEFFIFKLNGIFKYFFTALLMKKQAILGCLISVKKLYSKF